MSVCLCLGWFSFRDLLAIKLIQFRSRCRSVGILDRLAAFPSLAPGLKKSILLYFLPVIRRFRKNLEKRLPASSGLSVCPHGTPRLPLDGFSRNLIFEFIYNSTNHYTILILLIAYNYIWFAATCFDVNTSSSGSSSCLAEVTQTVVFDKMELLKYEVWSVKHIITFFYFIFIFAKASNNR
jgi:hypothetical protein